MYYEITLNLMRIVFGLMFWQHGAQKLLGWMGGFGGTAGATAPLVSMAGVAGILEFFGGLLLILGLFTRPVAFILSGEMAVAYFMAHAFNAFWPLMNRGELAVLYCFAFLFMAAAGGGKYSLDGKFRQKSDAGRTPLETVQKLVEVINDGDVRSALALYESKCVMVSEPGKLAAGTDALRSALEGFIALKPTLTMVNHQIIEAGDIAQYYSNWRLSGTGPDGSAVALEGKSSDVLRRQGDGRWLIVIDNPWGTGILG